ncbi:MAG: redoxin domain-containing protein [Rhodospirillales bacterium]|nr:redoxin domain-containing protein [Rhodospirillales bacterium]
MITPSKPVPELKVDTLSGDPWRLADQTPDAFTLVEFYRGYHCPRCKVHLLDLDHKVARFNERGCGVIAISMDSQERAEKSRQEWGLGGLTLGFGLSEETARQWGLFISQAIRDTEPTNFNEPGMFLVRPDGTLFSAVLHTTPFHRHHFADVLEAIDMIKARDYPPRGNV